MKLDDIYRNPMHALMHMERYVNKGSPSGFTDKYTVSKRYDPRSEYPYFDLPLFLLPIDEILIYNEENCSDYADIFVSEEEIMLPVHPDMVSMFSEGFGLSEFSKDNIQSHIRVCPTANGRTVYREVEAKKYYLKLHYHGILGRIFRALPWKKAVAGPEISDEIVDVADTDCFPDALAILPEKVALAKKCSHAEVPEISVVLRDAEAYPVHKDTVLIPFFSLFSKDSKAEDDPLLLCQVLDNISDPLTGFECLARLILGGYTYLVFDLGLLPEINAQNALLELAGDGQPMRMVLRDLQGWEKDISIRKSKGLCCKFSSEPYKCISREVGSEYYIRHSFSYDFKLGHYIFDEIVTVLTKAYGLERARLEGIVSEIFHELGDGREIGHFEPPELWFCHDKILLTEERPYISKSSPKYRRCK